jgi:hypothetical protein
MLARGHAEVRNPFDWEAELLDLRVGERCRSRMRAAAASWTLTVTVADLPEVSAPKVTVLRELELVSLTGHPRGAWRAQRAGRWCSACRTASRD